MNRNAKHLAINGGKPVTSNTVLIHKPYLDESDFNSVLETTKSTFVSGDGATCREFESKIADYLGVKHALFMNSCTAALELAFRVKRFKSGDEVIIPNFTYTSTALGALYNNLNIKLVDVDPLTGNIDVSKIESSITAKTVAIAPVDYAGNPAEMDEINKIAKKYNLFVVHDTAQSFGSEYKGRKTGALADVSTFSFHATKNLTTGEGGAFVTDNDEIADIVKIMREKGTDKHTFITQNTTKGYYEYVDIGHSYVQSNILGGLGITQLQKIDFMNQKRAEIASYYTEHLSHIPDIQLPVIEDYCKTNWHVFYILVPEEHKLWILDAIRAEGVITNVHYSPLHMNSYYSHLGTDSDFPGSVSLYNRLLRLPIYPSLTIQERELVVTAVKKVFDS
jgi:perosamine synthetase